jgi:hypothetical protein
MKFKEKIKKFIFATNQERYFYFSKFLQKIYTYILPFLRVLKWPFTSFKERRNIILDLLERITNKGSFIRYRYYLGFKLFYSCSENGTGIVNHITCNKIYEKDTCLF